MSRTSAVLIIILVIVIAILGGALIVKVRDSVTQRQVDKEIIGNSTYFSYEGSKNA